METRTFFFTLLFFSISVAVFNVDQSGVPNFEKIQGEEIQLKNGGGGYVQLSSSTLQSILDSISDQNNQISALRNDVASLTDENNLLKQEIAKMKDHKSYDNCLRLLQDQPELSGKSDFYLINGQMVWCDMAIDGGGWTIPVYPWDNYLAPNEQNQTDVRAAFQNFCASRGWPFAGRNTESVQAWVAQKMMLYQSNHSILRLFEHSAGPLLAMPNYVMGSVGGAVVRGSLYYGLPITIPPNRGGDHCDSTSVFCGLWNPDWGWNDGDPTVLPDPEDFQYLRHEGHDWTNMAHFSCMFR